MTYTAFSRDDLELPVSPVILSIDKWKLHEQRQSEATIRCPALRLCLRLIGDPGHSLSRNACCYLRYFGSCDSRVKQRQDGGLDINRKEFPSGG